MEDNAVISEAFSTSLVRLVREETERKNIKEKKTPKGKHKFPVVKGCFTSHKTHDFQDYCKCGSQTT